MKKNIIIFIIITLIIMAIFYCRPIGVSNLIQPFNSNNNLPWKIETAIFFSTHSEKKLDVINEESIEELINLIENIKVRRNIIKPQLYIPQLKETYKLFFYGEDSNNQYISILNSKYIYINNRQYKLIGRPNLSKIYDIIILDQAEGSLDKFYYDLIENK